MDPAKITVVREEPEPCRVRLNIEVPAEMVADRFAAAMRRFRRDARLPGFRKGKAPAELVLRKFDADIRRHVQDELVQTGVTEALRREEKQPASRIELSNPEQLRVDADDSFVFAVSYDVDPEFELPDYRSLQVEAEEVIVDEEQVVGAVDEWLENQATYEVVERPAAADDLLKVSYKGELAEPLPAGVELSESAKALLSPAAETWVPLREPGILPGVVDQLIGCSAGDEKELTVRFPEDYFEELLQGRTARIHMTILEVQGRSVPELTDEFAKQIGAEDAEAVRTLFRRRLELEGRVQRYRALQRKVLEAVTAVPDFPLPPRLLAAETQTVFMALLQAQFREGVSEEDLEGRRNELYNQAREIAGGRLKQRLILLAIAKAENLEVSAAEVTEAIREMSHREKVPEKRLRRRLEESGRIYLIIERLLVDKVLNWLIVRVEGADEARQEEASAAEAAAAGGDAVPAEGACDPVPDPATAEKEEGGD